MMVQEEEEEEEEEQEKGEQEEMREERALGRCGFGTRIYWEYDRHNPQPEVQVEAAGGIGWIDNDCEYYFSSKR
jgi:hypothetical protein